MADPSNPADMRIGKFFSTPIAIHRLPDANAINPGLKRAVLAAEKTSPSTRHSNIGGWRSEPDLLERPGMEFEILRQEILGAVSRMIKETAGEAGFNGYLTISAWANVLRRGNYNTLHNHPESAWSGVYYVDIGTETPAQPLSGLLELMDPRPFVEMVPTPGMPFGLPVRIQPEAGLMVLFPSWLYHHVHPYAGDEARIAIAFNVPALQANAPSPSEG